MNREEYLAMSPVEQAQLHIGRQCWEGHEMVGQDGHSIGKFHAVCPVCNICIDCEDGE